MWAGGAGGGPDAGSSWQPTFYLQDSAQKASLGKIARLAAASLPDTSPVVINVTVVRDTAATYIYKTEIHYRKLPVEKISIVEDTTEDTVRQKTTEGDVMTVVMRSVFDSLIVKDTVVVADTVLRLYKRVVVSVTDKSSAMTGAVLSADTQWVDMGVAYATKPATGDSNEMSDGRFAAASPAWQVDSISPVTASKTLAVRLISPPTKDTMIVPLAPTALQIRKNDLFISSKMFEGGVLVKTIAFSAIDSLLSIGRFNPSQLDTVESLSTDYSVDVGADRFSGSDDRLLGIAQRYSFRLGPFHNLALTLSPDRAGSPAVAQNFYEGMIAMTIVMADGRTGVFSGALDAGRRLIGVYEVDGKKYQVMCDEAFKVQSNEFK
jgi:hypothetical protein